jgi:hypothetical protein
MTLSIFALLAALSPAHAGDILGGGLLGGGGSFILCPPELSPAQCLDFKKKLMTDLEDGIMDPLLLAELDLELSDLRVETTALTPAVFELEGERLIGVALTDRATPSSAFFVTARKGDLDGDGAADDVAVTVFDLYDDGRTAEISVTRLLDLDAGQHGPGLDAVDGALLEGAGGTLIDGGLGGFRVRDGRLFGEGELRAGGLYGYEP